VAWGLFYRASAIVGWRGCGFKITGRPCLLDENRNSRLDKRLEGDPVLVSRLAALGWKAQPW